MQDTHLLTQREKKAQAFQHLNETISNIERRIHDDRKQIERLHQVKDGIVSSLEEFEELTEEQKLERAYKAEVRDYLRKTRRQIAKSKVLKKTAVRAKARKAFDLVYKLWVREGRPDAGVAIKRNRLCAVLGMSARAVDRLMTALKADGHVFRFSRSGLGFGQGRGASRYVCAQFPDRSVFVAEWLGASDTYNAPF